MTTAEREERAEQARNRARGLKGIKVEAVAAPYLFETPRALAARMAELADIKPGMRILEPSAGTGRIVEALPRSCYVDAIEISYALVSRLRAQFSGPYYNVMQADFLAFDILTGPKYSRVLMNPPFDHGLDIKHIDHALELLAPGGRLVAICADGPKQQKRFYECSYETLPPGTFLQAGTMVSSALVIIDK
jgi:protein-L-isoaspartate O-methyltransferase